MSLLPFSDFDHFLLRYYDNQPMFGRLEGQRNISTFVTDGEKQFTLNEIFTVKGIVVWEFYCVR